MYPLVIVLGLFIFLQYSPVEMTMTLSDTEKSMSPNRYPSPVQEKMQVNTIELPGLPEDAKKLQMVLIPPGSFTMGSPKEERRSRYEWPTHRVTIVRYLSNHFNICVILAIK